MRMRVGPLRSSGGSLADNPDSGSDDPNGHEDKRAHGNDKAAGGAAGSGRRGGRKSTGGAAGDAGSKEMSKAEKRKVQNRQAQEAFRKRREAKVKDVSWPRRIPPAHS